MSKPVIVKVQIPLFSTDTRMLCLVYDEEQRNVVQQSITLDTLKALRRDAKGYFEATWDKQMKLWIVGKRVEDRPW